MFLLALVVAGCDAPQDGALEGRPGGPYRLTLTLDPAAPAPGESATLTFRVTYAATGEPVRDLQVAHERLLHTFITDLAFRSFSHVHHEDFAALTDDDRRNATVSFPHRFPHAGTYRVVSEFVHRDRIWIKHFDVPIGSVRDAVVPVADDARTRAVGPYTGTLTVSPERPVAGFETDLELHIARDGTPVDDLALHLGTELHGAVWREDGGKFGHLHSFTPKVAAILDLAHDRAVPAAERGARITQMMVQLMCLESELVFPGPVVPMRYVFPAAGRYHVFLEVAPRGEPRVFHYAIDVAGS